MKKKDYENGIWRTIGGRRVFIRKGQDLSSAMKESGKFKKKETEEPQDPRKAVDYYLKKGEFEKADQYIKEYGLEDELDMFLEGQNYGVQNDYRKYKTNEDLIKEQQLSDTGDKQDKFYTRKDETNRYKEKTLNDVYSYTDKQIDENSNPLFSKEDKFYTRKDGTKEYDPYKGTRFEKKYDSVEEALNDPNHPTRKYIDEKEKTYHVPYQNGGVYTGGKTTEDYYEAKVYKEDDNSTSVLIPRSIHVTKDQLAEWNNGKSDFKVGDMAKAPYGIGNTYDNGKMYNLKLLKNGDYPELEGKIELHMTRQQAEGFEKDYQKLNSINRVKNNRVVENIKTGNKYYEIGNGQWRSEKDGYDYYIDFNSSNIDNPKYKDVASGRIINTNPRADNYWDYEGNGLKSKYKGTIDYLQKTTNMNNSEILELLKRIDEDKK